MLSMADNPLSSQTKWVSVSLGVTATFAVALRLAARWRSNADMGFDDYSILASLLVLYGMAIVGFLGESDHVLLGILFTHASYRIWGNGPSSCISGF